MTFNVVKLSFNLWVHLSLLEIYLLGSSSFLLQILMTVFWLVGEIPCLDFLSSLIIPSPSFLSPVIDLYLSSSFLVYSLWFHATYLSNFSIMVQREIFCVLPRRKMSFLSSSLHDSLVIAFSVKDHFLSVS